MPLQIVRNDITKIKVDAVVNSANPKVAVGEGVDHAIYSAAGIEQLLAARSEIGELLPGEAVVTPGFHLSAQYIIHTVGPVWQGGTHKEYDTLLSCYEKSLQLAKHNGCKSLAFPLISTGTYGFPKDKALQIAISSISQFLLREELTVFLVVYDKNSYELSGELFTDVQEFIDDHYVEKRKLEKKQKEPKRTSVFRSIRELDADQEFIEYHEIEFSKERYKAGTPFESPRKLEDVMDEIGETFRERLFRLIDERGLTDVEVYRKANMDRKHFSKIRCKEDYKPKKKTALALAIALGLNLDETIDLLSRAEIALSPSSKFDLIIRFFIENEVYDIYTINMALFEHNQPLLGE